MTVRTHVRISVAPLLASFLVAGAVNFAPASQAVVGGATTFPLVAGVGPRDVAVGPDNLLYVTNATNGTISKVGTDGAVIATFVVSPVNASPRGITAGPDGNLWFTLQAASAIGRITPQGTITTYTLPTASAEPVDIALGPDGNLWFTESAANKIGRITPQGAISEFPLPLPGSLPWEITSGPQGSNRMYFTQAQGGRVGWISTAGALGAISLAANANPRGIALINNSIWVAQTGANKLSQVTSDSTVSDVPFGDGPLALAGGPSNLIWVVNSANQISRANSAGQWLGSSPLPVAGAGASSVTLGPDGNLWVPMFNVNSLARVASGQVPISSKVPEVSPMNGVVSGALLSASSGSWQPSGMSFTYQWQRCVSTVATSCANIAGATSSSYAVVAADSGQFLRVGVTAVNASGPSTAAYSVTIPGPAATPAPNPNPGPSPRPATGPTASIGSGAMMELDAPTKQKRKSRKTYDVIFSATDAQGTVTLQFRAGSKRKTVTNLAIADGLVEFAWKAPRKWPVGNTVVVATFVPASGSKYTAAQVQDTVQIRN